MHQMLVLYRPPTNPAAFRAHYEAVHVPLAEAIPGLLGRRYAFDIAAIDGAGSPFFAMYQGDFEDEAAFTAGLASPEGQAAAADLANFATGGAVLLHYDVRK